MNPTRTLRAFSKPPSYLLIHPRHVSTTKTTKSSAVVTASPAAAGSTASNVLQTTFPQQIESLNDVAKPQPESPLAKLPLSNVLRSLLILSVSSAPFLLKPCIYTLSALAHPKTALTDVDRNPVLHWLIKKTIYKQFNAGENKSEVQGSITEIKNLGFRGVLLGYAREVLTGEGKTSTHDEKVAQQEVDAWLKGTLQGVEMATEGDFVALKFTGMGTQAVELLQKRLPPSEYIDAAIRKACDATIAKGTRLLVDAEEQAVQPGIEDWVMRYQNYCSQQTPGRATVYCTYQAYLKSTPATIAKHLAMSERDGYTLGVKLVRGAYMKIEQRHLIWDTKEDTDICYDGVVEALLNRRYNSMLAPAVDSVDKQTVPPVGLIIATHNRESVQKAHSIRLNQAKENLPRIELSYAQLQGMADEVSCDLINGFEDAARGHPHQALELPNVYKLLTWGSVQECMGFLLRRALENTEAVARTKDSQRAMMTELWRRMKAVLTIKN
ncbi:proline oxidase PrnD [Talaromyces proteolyticus]|uniref:Proline dehydrogenase n=1 Tax=Talaromyces proteolyticus TaxID=1131652 RepID=A0AAD4PU01_9EURO|nr:proline oxidase PrnD [Talaromyces proteolyticus]KAH8689521.1 proline oxidase PrnD [Talaromyces proteolyticus]